MNTKLLLLIFIIAGFSGCSTAYKTGQTPDDVYYSPAPAREYVSHDSLQQDQTVSSREDREIRNRIHDRRYRVYDDYGYDYYPYDYDYGYDYPIYVNPKYYKPLNNHVQPRKTNLGAYTKKPADNTAPANGKTSSQNASSNAPVRTFKTTSPQNGTGVGNFIRKVFSTPVNSSNNNNTQDNSSSRTFDNSRSNSTSNSSSSSSGSSGSSSNAPVRKFN